jgi:hypothetical protein
MSRGLLACILVFLVGVLPGTAFGLQSHPGYLTNVAKEKSESYVEVYLVMGANPAPEKSWHQVIFNEQLSIEFKNRYRETFGQIDTESIVYQPTKFSLLDEARPLEKTETDTEVRRQFAEYMTRRLFEFHVDNYFKTQPQMRTVYEVKERLKNVEVKVSKETKLNAQYSFASNILDLVFENPYLDSKVALEMDPSAFGPSQVEETRFWLGRDLSKTLRANTNFALTDGIGTFEFVKAFRWNIGSSIGYSGYFRNSGKSVREDRVSLGLSHSY